MDYETMNDDDLAYAVELAVIVTDSELIVAALTAAAERIRTLSEALVVAKDMNDGNAAKVKRQRQHINNTAFAYNNLRRGFATLSRRYNDLHMKVLASDES